MWELFIDIDYNAIRSAISAGYLLTFLLPFAAIYFFNKRKSPSIRKKRSFINTQQCNHATSLSYRPDTTGILRFLIFIRRKEGTDDSEKPYLLLNC
jgi:hypothetical protein